MTEFLSLWGFGEVWVIFPGDVGKIIEFPAAVGIVRIPFNGCFHSIVDIGRDKSFYRMRRVLVDH